MRKLLSVLICVMMMISIFAIGVSADETPVIITDAAQFAAMEAGGNYKLGADITITESVATFNATLDGDGHKIKTTVPIFTEISGGSISNLVIGDPGDEIVDTESKHLGALARSTASNAEVTFSNIVNNVSVTSAVSGSYRRGSLIGQLFKGHNIAFTGIVNNGNVKGGNMIGGIVGYGQEGVLLFSDCINRGNVTIDTEASLTGLAGGIIGREGGDSAYDEAKTLTIINCLNEGNISGTSNIGGIIGLSRGNKVTISNCTNKGAVSSSNNDAAGIMGHAGSGDYLSLVVITACVNDGAISCTGGTVDSETGKPTSGTNCAAGIIGYVYGSGDNGRCELHNCLNKGAVNAKAFASQFIGYTNNVRTIIENCIGDGTITGGVKVLVGLSSASPNNYNFSGITLTANDSTEYLGYATAAGNSGNIVSPVTAYNDVEGKAGSITVNGTYVQSAEWGYQAPASPSQGGDNPTTGDAAVWFAIAGAVALLGAAVTVKVCKSR